MADTNYFRRWFLIVFAFFCVGINIAAFLIYKKNETINTSKAWIDHTYEVISEEYNLFSLILDRQASQRGFLLTGLTSYLEQYSQTDQQLTVSLAKLKKLTLDNEMQRNEFAAYSTDLDILTSMVTTRIQQKKNGLMINPMDTSDVRPQMQKIRAHHATILENERNLLNKRKDREAELQENFIVTLIAAAGLSAIGLLIANGAVAFLTYRRKFAEEDLRRTNQEMEGFTYIASHDLRSPLVNLKGFATEMKYSLDELKPLLENNRQTINENDWKNIDTVITHDIPDALHYIHSSVEKMDKLTNAILELSRLGRRNLDIRTVDSGKIVRQILDTLHHTITVRQIEVKLGPMPEVQTDSLSLEQVFGNIIDNAIKYLDPGRQGKIEIGGTRSYRETKFWVKDNGRGVDKSDYQKVFEIYRRAGNSDNIPGEGMGMAYVRTTLRRLGGQIWCDSTPGLGSVFYFTISNLAKKGN